ncbi:MAG: epimerase [Calditrichia bacterium]
MKAIITGSTGMIGKGVLLECLDDPRVEEVLLINRRSVGISHPKIKEIIHPDFRDFSMIKDKLAGYDTCFFCMGVTSAGMSEESYTEITYTMTKALADTLHSLNPQLMFIYISGAGTDSSEKGRIMWARVKGRTENMVLNMGFRDAYAFRPGVIIPERGVTSRTKLYQFFYVLFRPFFPLLRKMKSVTTTSKIGRAMINLNFQPQVKKHIEAAEINHLAQSF